MSTSTGIEAPGLLITPAPDKDHYRVVYQIDVPATTLKGACNAAMVIMRDQLTLRDIKTFPPVFDVINSKGVVRRLIARPFSSH